MMHLKDVNLDDPDSDDGKIRIQYKDFPSDAALSTYLKSVMQDLQTESPSDSVLKATFSKTGHLFKGIVNIYSKSGRFFARAEDVNINSLSHKLTDRARKQLAKWKIQRFRIHKELNDPQMS